MLHQLCAIGALHRVDQLLLLRKRSARFTCLQFVVVCFRIVVAAVGYLPVVPVDLWSNYLFLLYVFFLSLFIFHIFAYFHIHLRLAVVICNSEILTHLQYVIIIIVISINNGINASSSYRWEVWRTTAYWSFFRCLQPRCTIAKVATEWVGPLIFLWPSHRSYS